MGLEISDPVLFYIRSKSEILTGNPEILWDILEIPQKKPKTSHFRGFHVKMGQQTTRQPKGP